MATESIRIRWEGPDTGEIRLVTVPMVGKDEITPGTLRSIADQCSAEDFEAWCRWIDEHARGLGRIGAATSASISGARDTRRTDGLVGV